MISEIRLFLDNIKPALLLKTVDDDLKDFYIKEVDGGFIISRNEIPQTFTAKSLGINLGYYPRSCENFFFNKNKTILDFNGIRFNTGGYTQEAIEWCKQTYGKLMIEKYNNIKYTLEENGTVLETIEINNI